MDSLLKFFDPIKEHLYRPLFYIFLCMVNIQKNKKTRIDKTPLVLEPT